ncbi:MAG: Cytochrome-c peroxidase [Bacteroidetes bacterium]|nr:Cytochrome-c peroxidase [Bacteroidota bacterium]
MRTIFILMIVVVLMASCAEKVSEKNIYSEVQLGEALFFDPILSRDSSVSCASCHKPQFAFADNVAFSKGIASQLTKRNTPSAMNQGDRNFYFWDGRSETLEHQALGPVENSGEMDFPGTLLVRRLLRNAKYKEAFRKVYSKNLTKDLIAAALSAYERTLETSDSPFDKYMTGKDTTLFSESAKRGLSVFNDKAKCFDCHFGVDFTGNDEFKNIGLYDGDKLNDKGRYLVTLNKKDLGAFKVPGLRNIVQTAPYMHNGMFKTLREVIDYYDKPDKFVQQSINRDSLLRRPLALSEKEKQDLENFLKSLSDARFSMQK